MAATTTPMMASFTKPAATAKIHYFKQGSYIGGGKSYGGAGTGDQTVAAGKVKGTDFKGRDMLETVDMQVYDARPSMSEWAIDTHGFRFAQHSTKLHFTIENLFDDTEADIRKVYFPEIEELCRRQAVLADGRLPKYAFGLRAQKFSEERDRGFLASYSRQAHCDFADIIFGHSHTIIYNAAKKRGQTLDLEELKGMDHVIYNTWQPVMRPAYNDPLLMLDYRSVNEADSQEFTRDMKVAKTKDGKPMGAGCSLSYNPAHRWVYLSNMTPEEIIIMKMADSRPWTGPQARHTFHTSFHDAAVDPTLPGRRSITLNVMCAYEKPAAAKL